MDARAPLRRTRAELGEVLGVHRRALEALDGSAAAVLTYHRILPEAEARRLDVEPGMVVTPETFRRHCEWLRDGFRVLPLAEIRSRLAEGRALPPRACAISFDDGWRDNADHAAPVLRALGLPATLFVVTGRIGSEGAFWPDEVMRRLSPLSHAERRRVLAASGMPAAEPLDLAPWKQLDESERERHLDALRRATSAPEPSRELLDWDEVHGLARQGIDIESHGDRHLLLTRVPAEVAARDLRDAAQRLRDEGLGRGRLLAYPGGDCDGAVCALAARCGYAAAFTTRLGWVRRSDPAWRLPRVGLHEDVSKSRSAFRRRLAGAARLPDHRKGPSASPAPTSRSAILRAARMPASR